ncbi:MAG: terminase small subunit [Pseudomonadota bacterium]
MARRQRIDTVKGAVDVAQKAAAVVLSPPSNVPLLEEELPFFASVIDELPKSEWTPHKLELAALLARMMAMVEKEMRELAGEPSVVVTEKGGLAANPRHRLIDAHKATIMSMRRSLALHARAQGGEARDQGKRRDAAKDIDDGIADEDDHGLLA